MTLNVLKGRKTNQTNNLLRLVEDNKTYVGDSKSFTGALSPTLELVRPKQNICVFQVSALKKTSYGWSALSFYFIKNILYRNCIFHYVFHHFPAYLTIFCSQFTIKCLGSGQKRR